MNSRNFEQNPRHKEIAQGAYFPNQCEVTILNTGKHKIPQSEQFPNRSEVTQFEQSHTMHVVEKAGGH